MEGSNFLSQSLSFDLPIDSMDAYMTLFGMNDQNISLLEQECQVSIVLRGQKLIVSGEESQAQLAIETIQQVLQMISRHEYVDRVRIRYVLSMVREGKADLLDESLKNTAGYRQFEYVNEGLSDLFAAADVVISRAGANAICELLALHKPNLLIPLSAAASRGDQILNAASFEKQGYSLVLKEEDMTDETLLQKVAEVWERREEFAANMAASPYHNGVGTIIDLIEETVEKKA